MQYLELATALGAGLAAAGHYLVSGGGAGVDDGRGGARRPGAGGARTTGVIPRSMTTREIADRDADELVVVETMRERKRIMAERSDAFVALPGGLGTLEELLEVWTTRSLGMQLEAGARARSGRVLRPVLGLPRAPRRPRFRAGRGGRGDAARGYRRCGAGSAAARVTVAGVRSSLRACSGSQTASATKASAIGKCTASTAGEVPIRPPR